MSVPVARALRKTLVEVVENGTARRVAGAFKIPEGKPMVVGGKTGSGDNRFDTFAGHGRLHLLTPRESHRRLRLLPRR